MKRHPMLLVTALVLVLAGGSAAADTHAQGMNAEDMHCEMKGHDKMDAAERKKMMDKMFGQLDVNRDGAISRVEFQRHQEQMWARHDDDRKSRAHDHVEQHK